MYRKEKNTNEEYIVRIKAIISDGNNECKRYTINVPQACAGAINDKSVPR